MEASGHPGAPTAARLFAGLLRKQMRDYKGIRVLLAICPSSHRSEDFLSQPKVSWNLKLSRMSLLLSLYLLSQFPACLSSCHFHCAGFSLGTFSELGFWCVWPLPCGSSGTKVISARLNPRNGTIYVGGVCSFLTSVFP